MDYTENYNLKKPSCDDPVDIDDLNGNADIIDGELAKRAELGKNGKVLALQLPENFPANGGNADTVNGHTVKADVPANAKFTDTVDGGNAATVNGHTVKADVPANAKFTDTTYSNASASAAGLVSTGTQTFAGKKTFTGQVIPDGATACGTAQARKLASGTAAATTTNCPSGAWYGKYE